MEWHKGTISKMVQLTAKPNEKKSIKITYYHGNEKGYSDNDVTVCINKDGSIYFGDEDMDNRGIYLYPEQAKHLRKILK